MAVTGEEPSLRIIAAQAGKERALLTAHANAMDANAGVLVGFGATITAFSVPHHSGPVRAALFFSLVASITGLAAVFRRRRTFKVINLAVLCHSLTDHPLVTTQRLLGAEREIVRRIEQELAIKALLLRASATSLVLALVLLLVANLVA